MTVTTTPRLTLSKPDGAELVSIALINANSDKIDSNFIPAAKMTASAAQSVPNNALTTAAFNTTGFDTYAARPEGAMVNLTTDTITIRKDGIYYVSLNAAFVANATGVRRGDIRKNGTSLLSIVDLSFSGGANCVKISDFFAFVTNDAITGGLFQNSGAALNADGNTFAEGMALSVIWVGSLT